MININSALPKRLYKMRLRKKLRQTWHVVTRLDASRDGNLIGGGSPRKEASHSGFPSDRLIIPLFLRLLASEGCDVAWRAAEEATISRTSQRYRPTDCRGGHKRRRQSPSVRRRIRDRILRAQSELNKIYSRLARILSQDALSVRQGPLTRLPRSGKPVASRIRSVIREESSQSIKSNIANHHAVVQLRIKSLYRHVIHVAVICTGELWCNDNNKHR